MTWRKELAFWTFMFIVGIWFMWGLLQIGMFLTGGK
jgi:hypothetical protein